jgi:hypothetical protein
MTAVRVHALACAVVLQGAASHAAAANLSMNVSIQGLGPRFRLLLNFSNEGQDLATDLQVRLMWPNTSSLCLETALY